MAVCPGRITTGFFDHAIHDDIVSYFNRYYTPKQLVEKAMEDVKKSKYVPALGFPELVQAQPAKLSHTSFVVKTRCRQQGRNTGSYAV